MRFNSILKKVAMAVTGLGFFLFAVTHLTGNLLIFQGPEAFNGYSEKLHTFGGLLYLAEIGLLVLIVVHATLAMRVTRENRQARPNRYQVSATAGEATFASRTMAVGGIVLLLFLILHVRAFRFGDTSGPGGLWGLVMRTFQDPKIVAFYVVSMLALGLHLSHGIASGLQTLGTSKPHWRPTLRKAGMVIGWVMALGFASLPLWSFVAARPG